MERNREGGGNNELVSATVSRATQALTLAQAKKNYSKEAEACDLDTLAAEWALVYCIPFDVNSIHVTTDILNLSPGCRGFVHQFAKDSFNAHFCHRNDLGKPYSFAGPDGTIVHGIFRSARQEGAPELTDDGRESAVGSSESARMVSPSSGARRRSQRDAPRNAAVAIAAAARIAADIQTSSNQRSPIAGGAPQKAAEDRGGQSCSRKRALEGAAYADTKHRSRTSHDNAADALAEVDPHRAVPHNSLPTWNVVIKVSFVMDQVHYIANEHETFDRHVELQVQDGSKIFDLKLQLARHARRPAEKLRLVFLNDELHDELVVGRDEGKGLNRPWFRGSSGGKVVNLLGRNPSSWNLAFVMAHARRIRHPPGGRAVTNLENQIGTADIKTVLGDLPVELLIRICREYELIRQRHIKPPKLARPLSMADLGMALTALSRSFEVSLDPTVPLLAKKFTLLDQIGDEDVWYPHDVVWADTFFKALSLSLCVFGYIDAAQYKAMLDQHGANRTVPVFSVPTKEQF